MKITISNNEIENKIYLLRGQKVMLDSDLAELYKVETKVLNQAVTRNKKRFPDDFMFQISQKEWLNLKSQFVTSSWGGRRKLPYVFTEHGVLMLSSVLNSERAILVNIRIMRIYVKIREMLVTNKDLLLKMERLEKKVSGHDGDIQNLSSLLNALLTKPKTFAKEKVGYKRNSERH